MFDINVELLLAFEPLTYKFFNNWSSILKVSFKSKDTTNLKKVWSIDRANSTFLEFNLNERKLYEIRRFKSCENKLTQVSIQSSTRPSYKLTSIKNRLELQKMEK